MDIKALALQAIALAKAGATILPALGGGAAIAENILKLIDSFKQTGEVPEQTAEELEAAHRELFDAMMAKGHDLSAALRGEG